MAGPWHRSMHGGSLCLSTHNEIDSQTDSSGGYGTTANDTPKPATQFDDFSNHCHTSLGRRDDAFDRKAFKKIVIASILCLSFMLIEVVGGILANSLAIATDAAHLLTDFASFMISLLALKIASWPASKRMSFGWHRAEVIGALVSVLLIWVVTGVLVYMAVDRIIYQDFEIDAEIMLVTAAIGVAINIIMGMTLHQHGHSHGGSTGHHHSHDDDHDHDHDHDHDESHMKHNISKQLINHQYGAKPVDEVPDEKDTAALLQADEEATGVTLEEDHEVPSGEHSHHHSKKININVRAAFIHVLGDLLNSVGVLTAALIIYFKPQWKIADPICTFIFSALVLITTINILKDAINVLMEGTPKGLSYNDIRLSLLHIKGVKEIHDLRIWSLTMSKAAVSVHLALVNGADQQKILTVARKMLKTTYGIYESTIQVEFYQDEMRDCDQCKSPKD